MINCTILPMSIKKKYTLMHVILLFYFFQIKAIIIIFEYLTIILRRRGDYRGL